MEAVKDQVNLGRGVRRRRATPPGGRRACASSWSATAAPRRVEAILAAAGLRDLAWLPGERATCLHILRGLDCFVLPSLAEGVSNTILEAMASGLPVVATRVGGNPELVDDGVTGRLVPAADSEAMAARSSAISTIRRSARRHGRAARQVAVQRFSLDRMVARLPVALRRAAAAARTVAARDAGTPSHALHRRHEKDKQAMCGITGIFDTRERREIARSVLARMNESQHHRGPDEGGYHVEPGLGLGHRRLSIIDRRDRPAAAVQRGRQRRRHLQRRDLQLPGADSGARRRSATRSAPAATPRSSCTRGRRGAKRASSASAGCSRSRSGTATARRCSSPATGSA